MTRSSVVILLIFVLLICVFMETVADKSINDRLASIEADLKEAKINQGYFSSALSMQTGIFSIIVVVLIAVSWVFSYKRVNDKIAQKSRQMNTDIQTWQKHSIDILDEFLTKELENVRNDLKLNSTRLQGDIDRAFAVMHENQPSISYIWWMRAAHNFYLIGAEEWTRIALNGAHGMLKKLKYYEIELNMSEITTILNALNQEQYKFEIDHITKQIQKMHEETA